MEIRKSILACGLTLVLSGVAMADDTATDSAVRDRGDRIEHRLDTKGDRINSRLDRKSDRAAAAGHERRAARLDRKGDIIDRRLDRKGQRIDRRMDRRADRRS